MGKVVDDSREAIENREKFEKFKALKEKCFEIFEKLIVLKSNKESLYENLYSDSLIL